MKSRKHIHFKFRIKKKFKKRHNDKPKKKTEEIDSPMYMWHKVVKKFKFYCVAIGVKKGYLIKKNDKNII